MSALDDPERLAALEASEILDGEALPGLERLLRVARHALGTPTVMFNAVDVDRQVFIGHLGLPDDWAEAGETPLSHSYCRLVVIGDEALIVTDAPDDERVKDNPATAEVGIGAYLGAPVRTHDGHTIGAFCAIAPEAREWSDDDLTVLHDLAASVEVEIRLRELSRELADQLESESLERGFEQSMTALAAATSRSWTVDSVARAIVENGRAATGAALVTVALHDDNGLHLFDFEPADGNGDDPSATWTVLDLDAPLPLALAARTQEVVVLANRSAMAEWPAFERSVTALGLRSFVAVPVGDTDSGSRAVIGVGWTRTLKSRALPRAVSRLGALARQGFDRAHSHQMAREHAELLETLVLPDRLPATEYLDLAGIYLPPSAGQRVGGDLYDAVLRDDGKVALITADAAGHDIIGSLVTSRVRNAFTMLSLDLRNPSRILRYVNRYLLQSTMATHVTAVVAVVDTENRTMTIANAGHPQPRLRRADGTVAPVGPTGEPLLGVHKVEYSEVECEFAPGDSLLMFTDGLIERRDMPLTESELWLERALADDALVDAQATLNRFADLLPTRNDDVAMIVARHRAEATDVDLELEWPADQLYLKRTRAVIGQWLGRHPHLDDALLVATELLTNARTASVPGDALVRFHATAGQNSVTIRVENHGPPLEIGEKGMPDITQKRGRGLAITAAIADLRVENTDDGRVIVTARLPGPGATTG